MAELGICLYSATRLISRTWRLPMGIWNLRARRLAVAVALCSPLMAAAQYPTAIAMIVPFPPGGVADTVGRPVAEALARELGQTVVVENRAGAGGATGMGAAARAPADGYTLLMSLSSISILPEADKILGRKPQFTLDQFKPIARFTADPTVLVVRADAPWQSFAEFVADAKRKPGAYNYGSSGNYGTMHVPMEMLKASAGFRMVHIPFTGAGPAVVALLGGQVDAIASGPATVAQHVRSGRLRALAHWGERPLLALPDVPSLTSLGHRVKYAQWSGLFVPAGVPDDIVQRLRAAARRAAADPQVQQVIRSAGSANRVPRCAEFQSYWDADAALMVDAVRRIERWSSWRRSRAVAMSGVSAPHRFGRGGPTQPCRPEAERSPPPHHRSGAPGVRAAPSVRPGRRNLSAKPNGAGLRSRRLYRGNGRPR
jgi:tripartite-type tricarboxylate transporter receptor subunit TctC